MHLYQYIGTLGALRRQSSINRDDQDWTVRYVVVDTGGWLSGRQVLIAPLSIVELELNVAPSGDRSALIDPIANR